eukprot:1061722-Prymnesium_polylepis.1
MRVGLGERRDLRRWGEEGRDRADSDPPNSVCSDAGAVRLESRLHSRPTSFLANTEKLLHVRDGAPHTQVLANGDRNR